MPQYILEDAETKRRLVVEGDRAPTESEIEALFEAGERDPNISREWIYEETWRELPASDKALNDIAGLPSSAAQIIGGGVRGVGRVAAAAGPSAMLMTGGMAPSPAAFERQQAISRQVPDTISGRLTQPNQIVDAGHAIEDAAAKAFPNNQPESVNRPGRFVAEAVGNVGGALAAGPAALAFGTVAELNDAYERELQRQITAKEEPNPEKAFIKATVYSGSTVPIEMGLGVGRILRKVKQYFGSKVADEAAKKALTGGKEIAYDFLKERMKDSAAGFSQEFAEALIQDLIVEGHVDLANELKEALAGAIGQTVIGGAAQGTAIAAKQTGRKFGGEPKPSVRLPTDSDTAGGQTPPGKPQPPAGDSTAPLIGPDGKPMREIKAGGEIVSEVQRAFEQNKPVEPKQERGESTKAEPAKVASDAQSLGNEHAAESTEAERAGGTREYLRSKSNELGISRDDFVDQRRKQSDRRKQDFLAGLRDGDILEVSQEQIVIDPETKQRKRITSKNQWRVWTVQGRRIAEAISDRKTDLGLEVDSGDHFFNELNANVSAGELMTPRLTVIKSASNSAAESGATKAQTQNEKLAEDLGDLNAVINDLRDSLLKSEIVKNEAQTEVAEPAEPAPAGDQQETVDPGQAEQPLKALSEALQRYEDTGEIETVRDLVDEVDNMIETGRAPGELRSAVDAYREAAKEDFEELGGRGDMDAADEAFLGAMRKAAGVETQPAPTATPAQPQSTQETSQQRIDVSAITNAETEDAMVKALGEVVAVAKTKEEIAQAKAAASQWKEDRKPTAADVIDAAMGERDAGVKAQVQPSEVKPVETVAQQKSGFNAKQAKEQKKFLLAEVDKAIGDAPSADKVMPQGWVRDEFKADRLAADAADITELLAKYKVPETIPAYPGVKGIEGWSVPSAPEKVLDIKTRREMLKSAISRANSDARPTVVIEVPGDGVFTLVNTKEALTTFKQEYAKRFPTSAPKAATASTPRGTQTKAAALGDTDKQSIVKAMELFTADDPKREVLGYIYSDGKSTVATNGRMMLEVRKGIGGNQKNPILVTPEGKKGGEDLKFPNYKQVIPNNTTPIAKDIDTARLFNAIKQAEQAVTERDPNIQLLLNPDGSIAVRVPDNGTSSYAHNVKYGAKIVVTINPKYAAAALNAARIVGDEKVSISVDFTRDNVTGKSPIVVDSKNTKAVVMSAKGIEETPDTHVTREFLLSKQPPAMPSPEEQELAQVEPEAPTPKPDVRNLSKPQLIEEILGKKPEGVSLVQDRVAWEQRYKAYAKRTKQELAQIVEADRAQKQKQDAIQQLVRPIFDSLKAEAEAAGQDWRAVLKARAEQEGVSAYYPKDATRGEAAATIANKIAEKRYATTSAQPSHIGEVPVKKEAEKKQGTMFAAPRGGEQVFESAKRNHGTTDRIEEAGYILPDGTLLDFSGRANATGYERKSTYKFGPKPGQPDYLAGNRQVDHREIEYAGRPSREGANDAAMEQFLELGAIRTGQGLLDIRKPPTPEQWRRIREVISYYNGAVSLDLSEGKRNAGQWWPDGTRPAKIEGQIRRFFAGQEIKTGEQFAAPQQGQTAISDATDEINQFLGTETLPDKVQIVYEPDAPYAGYFRDGKVVINAAKTSDPVAVLLEEGMHGVIAALRSGEITDIGLLDALNEFADKVTQADIAREKALREGLDTRADVLAEEATIQKVLNENPTLVQRLVNAIRRAFKKLLGVELPADGRTRILEAAVSYLKSRNQSLPGKRFVSGNAVITAPGMGVYRNSITAHHGTPHEVDRFTTAKIGTGEGAQVYGWGLYFAENPEVAKEYKKSVPYADLRRAFLGNLPENADFEEVLGLVGTGHFTPYQERIIKALDADSWLGFDYPSQAISAAFKDLSAYDPSPELRRAIEAAGSVYTVAIDVEPDELLDWDKPLSGQSEKVKLAVRNKAGSDDIDVNGVRVTGSTIYDDLVSEFVNKSPGKYGQVNRWKFSEDASRYLASLGIKGIRYADQGSRNYGLIWEEGGLWFGQPSDSKVLRQFGADAEAAKAWSAEEKSKRTYNYVIFDESVIKITHKNGQPVSLSEAMGGETRFAAPRGQKQREAILPEAPDEANANWRNRAKKKQPTKQEEYTKGVLARAVASFVHGDALPKAFREARQWGLSFQKFIEESLRVLTLDARKALHAEFKTEKERLAAEDRLLAYWTGQAELNTVGGPALQRAAEAFRQTVDQLTTLAVRNGLVPEGLEDTWLGNRGAWLKRTYLAFDPTADWNYDTLKRRAARGDAEIRRIWSGIVAYLERQNPNMEPEELEAIMRSLIDRREVEDILGLSAQPLAGSGKRFSVDISSLLRRKDLPIEVREWMGQIKDPFVRGLQSGKWMAQFITRNLVQRKFARLGLEMGLLSESKKGRKRVELYPNINQIDQARDEEGNPITTEDGRPVGEWRQKVDRRREPLHGFYTSPEFVAALREFDGTFNQMRGAFEVLDAVIKLYIKGIGYIKVAKVGLNPYSYMLNTLGGVVMRLAAGGVNPVHFKDAFSAIAFGKNPVDGPMTAEQAQARMNYLLATKAGVTGRGVLLGDVRTNLERDTEPEEFKRALAAIRAILSDPKGGGAWVRLRDALTDIAQIPGNYGIKFMDDVFRVSAFLDELALARKAFPDQSEQQHVEWAADRASNVYQSYDRLLPVLRGLSRASVLGTFISFKFELFRNTYWVARYAAQGISSDNAALKQDGYKKAVGLMAMVGAPFALAALSRAENDTDDDDVRAFQRWAVPPWDRGEELVIVSRNGTRWRYVPMGYMLPHYEITRAINAGWKAAHDPNPDIALRKAVQGMAADYFGPGAFLGPGIDALTNKRSGGGQITYAEGWQGVKDRAAYLLRAWGPNIGDPLYQAYMGMTDQKGTYGREYDIAEVGLKLAGIRVRTVDVARQLPFSMREFGERWKNATAYANIAKRKYPSDQGRQDIAEAYRVDTQAELKRQYAQFYRDMLKLGVSEQQFLIAEKEVTLPKELRLSRVAQ